MAKTSESWKQRDKVLGPKGPRCGAVVLAKTASHCRHDGPRSCCVQLSFYLIIR